MKVFLKVMVVIFMGNKQVTTPIVADSFGKEPVNLQGGNIVTPLAENSDAVVYSTSVKGLYSSKSKEVRSIDSVLGQNHGRYLVRPKNVMNDGKILQVKSINPEPGKLYYIVRKQEGADKWINNSS
jgi:hypothetical protein